MHFEYTQVNSTWIRLTLRIKIEQIIKPIWNQSAFHYQHTPTILNNPLSIYILSNFSNYVAFYMSINAKNCQLRELMPRTASCMLGSQLCGLTTDNCFERATSTVWIRLGSFWVQLCDGLVKFNSWIPEETTLNCTCWFLWYTAPPVTNLNLPR